MGRPRKVTEGAGPDTAQQKGGAAAKGAAKSAMESAAAKKNAAEVKSADIKKEDVFTKAEVERLISEAVKKAVAEQGEKRESEDKNKDKDNDVSLMYLAEVSSENVLSLPYYGTLRPGSVLTVKKSEWSGKFMTPLAVKLLKCRHLILLSGLDCEERERWGVNYKDGEVLDARAFDRLLDMDKAALCETFSRLCFEHQRFVARRFITAFERGDNRVSIDKVKALNELCKSGENEGILRPLLERLGERLLD